MTLIFRKVLDIDLTTKYSKLPIRTENEIEHIIDKIARCPFFVDLEIHLSSFKGFRIFVFCSMNCDICRLCYDDDKHFAYDMNRPEYARNISFDKKEKIKMWKQKELDFPEWFKPFSIGFDILDLIDVLRKYNVSQKTEKACINFYCGRKINENS